MQEQINKNNQCPNCNKDLTEQYCQFCGERLLDPKQRSISYLLTDVIESFTSLENRLLKSVTSFFLRPGELTRNYSIGKRVEYVKPVTFFLLVNLIYVIFTPITDFNVSFYDQLNSQLYSSSIKPFILHLIEFNNLDYKQVSNDYKQVTAVLSRSLIILSAPLLAIFIAMIYRKKNIFFADHLVFSMYLYAWVMCWIILAQIPAYLLFEFGALFNNGLISGRIYFHLLLVGLIAYLFLSSRRAFEMTWLQVSMRIPFAIVAFIISHLLYRFLQLFISILVVIVESN